MQYENHPKSPRFKDLTGEVYGELKVLGYAGKIGRSTSWFCECKCGKKKTIRSSSLKISKSCGCLNKNRTHGLSNTSSYKIFKSAKARCNNPGDPRYYDYEGRGIKFKYIDITDMIEDIGPRPKRMTLDRIDNNGNYERGNCKWASYYEQSNNARSNVKVKIGRTIRNASQWASEEIDERKIVNRIRRYGWPPKLAVFGLTHGRRGLGARKIAEESIKGKTIKELSQQVSLKIPLI